MKNFKNLRMSAIAIVALLLFSFATMSNAKNVALLVWLKLLDSMNSIYKNHFFFRVSNGQKIRVAGFYGHHWERTTRKPTTL